MRSVLVVVAALIGVLGVAGCEPRTANDSSRRIYCQVVADAPERDNDDVPRRVVGRVRYWCDAPGASPLSLTLRLQKQDSRGTWVDVARTSFTVRGGQTTRTEAERYRSRTVSVPCSDGAFRTLVSGSSRARGVTTRYSMTGARAFSPCDSGLLAG
jgi:hypothetical protein